MKFKNYLATNDNETSKYDSESLIPESHITGEDEFDKNEYSQMVAKVGKKSIVKVSMIHLSQDGRLAGESSMPSDEYHLNVHANSLGN